MRWLPLLLLFGCETNEVHAWKLRREQLEAKKAELTELEAAGRKPRVDEFRRAIDLAGFVRDRSISARVFVEPSVVRVTASGTVQDCRDTLHALTEVRWLTAEWRLRLEKGRCDWEARTGEDYVTLEHALVAPPVKWSAPPAQLLSKNLSELKAIVAALELDVQSRETRLGTSSLLQGKLDAVQPLIDSLKARTPPCDLAVLDRELALDAPEQGALLEVERGRLVHPLDPRGDFRLRGLVEFHDGPLTWHCEPL